ncbi:MAG: DegT/DnrJ/EryC1/StrS family aminotransferase [Halobacteriota archaeon]
MEGKQQYGNLKVPAAKINFSEEDRRKLLAQIDEILESGQLTLGKHTSEFEKQYATYIGVRHAIAVNSGTSALEISLRALDVAGSSVIVPTNTFFATPASAIHAGGRVVFADVTDNLCLDPASVKQNIQEDTKGVIVVHIGGLVPPQLAEIQEICDDHGLFLIEDAAHAHGSTWKAQKAGSFGIAGAFSFYPTKVMTSAEGGMITTNDETIYERALVFRDQGKGSFTSNLHTEMGYNWRMSEIHAAVGLSQLARLEEFIADRRSIARVYDEGFAGSEALTPLTVPPQVNSNYYKYVAFPRDGTDRQGLKKQLKENYGVSLSGEVYELPCHLQPVFKDHPAVKSGKLPVSEEVCGRHVCLPVFAGMTQMQADHVVDSLQEVMK